MVIPVYFHVVSNDRTLAGRNVAYAFESLLIKSTILMYRLFAILLRQSTADSSLEPGIQQGWRYLRLEKLGAHRNANWFNNADPGSLVPHVPRSCRTASQDFQPETNRDKERTSAG